MGILHDLLLEAKTEQFEKDLKDAYGMGFRDGRLCGPDHRPCLADDKSATFIRWVDEDRGMLRINAFMRPHEQDALHRRFLDDGIIPSCCSMEALRSTLALVEYPDGSVGKVKPELIQFLDRGDEAMG